MRATEKDSPQAIPMNSSNSQGMADNKNDLKPCAMAHQSRGMPAAHRVELNRLAPAVYSATLPEIQPASRC